MNGILVVNSFIQSAKFNDLYSFFERAAKSRGMRLDVRTSAEICKPVGQRISLSADFILFWDKDIPLAESLEEQGYKVFNSARSIAVCDDKALTAAALYHAGIPTPKTLIAPKTFSNIGYVNDGFLIRAEEFLSYPYVIKHRCGSFGMQVFLAHDRREAAAICRQAGGNEVILQEFVSESAGKDLRVNIVGGEVEGVILRQSKTDFRSNITLGGSMKKFRAPKAYTDLAKKAADAAGVSFAGVDVLFGKDGPIVCEVNASPHFKTTYECTGIDLSQKILDHISKTVEKG